MGLIRFSIELDNPERRYETGSILSGKVYLDLDASKSVKGFKVTVYGRGRLYFRRRKRRVRAVEVYLDEDKYILGPNDSLVIPAGNHVYPFSFTLPKEIPNTYRDPIGRIDYKVVATIHRAWYLCDHLESTAFDVVVPLDLNAEVEAAEQVLEVTSETLTGYSDPIYMTISLPVRGYVPGQTVPVQLRLKNEARVNLRGIWLSLIKVCVYNGKYSRKKTLEFVLSDDEAVVQETDGIEMEIRHAVPIPEVEPSFLRYSKLIDIRYLIRVEVRVGRSHLKVTQDVPIIIGSVALLARSDQDWSRLISNLIEVETIYNKVC